MIDIYIDVATARFNKEVIVADVDGLGIAVSEVAEGEYGIRSMTIMDGWLVIHYHAHAATMVPSSNITQADRAVRK